MTTPISNIDNTTLIALTANLDVGDIADPALRLAYFQYLNVYIQVITAAHNAFVANGAIASANIADLAISTAKIALLAVGTAQLADSSVTSAKIVDGAIATIDIANLAITAAKIALLAVGTAQLADSSVTSAKILDGTILNVDIKPLAGIDPAKLADGSVNATKFQYINTLIGNVQTQLNKKPEQTLANIDYYVSPTGSDAADGSIGAPFLTIQHAADMIPQMVNHDVNIYPAAGTYAEDVVISGFSGRGTLKLNGTGTATDVNVRSLSAINCGLYVQFIGITLYSTVSDAAYVRGCIFVYLLNLRIVAAAAGARGVYCFSSKVQIGFCTISNRSHGIYAGTMSDVFSQGNSGSGNTIGLYANASTILKNTTQPGGTTAEATINGGEMR